MEPVGFGLVGCGDVAVKHARALAEAKQARLVAVCDVEPSRAQEVAQTCGARFCATYEELLGLPGVEVVDLATPADTHLPLGAKAARAGRHLLVEKPLAATLSDADALIGACGRAGVKLGVMLQKRLDPVVAALAVLARSGALGRVRLASLQLRWNRDAGYFGRAPWRQEAAAGGGCLMNQAIHGLDLLAWICGPVEEAFAYLGLPGGGLAVEENAVAVLRLPGGGLGAVEASTSVYPRSLELTLSVFGERGTVCLAGANLDSVRLWEVEGGGGPPPAAGPEAAHAGHQRVIEGLARAVREDGPPPVDGAQARAGLELALALRLSARRGAPVRLPLSDDGVAAGAPGDAPAIDGGGAKA